MADGQGGTRERLLADAASDPILRAALLERNVAVPFLASNSTTWQALAPCRCLPSTYGLLGAR